MLAPNNPGLLFQLGILRYSENDLSSTFWVDEKDEVDELRAPKPGPDGQPGTEPEVIPIQGPRAPKKPGPPKPPPVPEGLEPDPPPGPSKTDFPRAEAPQSPLPDGQDTLQRTGPPPSPSLETLQQKPAPPARDGSDSFQSAGTPQSASAPDSLTASGGEAPKPPSMEDLLARFHQATKDYQERAQQSDVAEEEPEPTEDSSN